MAMSEISLSCLQPQIHEIAANSPVCLFVGGKRLVRVGCATTNERLRRWCLDNKLVTLPFNVIMVETTLGGSTSALCHGSGRTYINGQETI